MNANKNSKGSTNHVWGRGNDTWGIVLHCSMFAMGMYKPFKIWGGQMHCWPPQTKVWGGQCPSFLQAADPMRHA